MRVVIGGLLSGVILYFVPGVHSGPACVIAGMAMTFLLLQLGPRSYVERIGAVGAVALLAWCAGPSAYKNAGIVRYFLGWLLAGSALAYYLRPKSE